MRETTSSHRECLHTPASRLWRSTTRVFRPHLNVPLFTKLLAAVGPDVVVSGSGKRKAVGSLPTLHRSKRTRTFRGSHDEDDDSGDESDGSEVFPTKLDGYPPVRIAENRTSDSALHPILRHIAEIQYLQHSSEINTEDIQTLKTWDNEDKSLLDVLYELRDSTTSEATIDLGELHIGDYDGHVVALPSPAKYHMSEHEWLLLFPSLPVDGPSNDYSDSTSIDLLSACRILQDAGKVRIEANLKVVVQSKAENVVPAYYPFSLRLEFMVSLALPRALEYTMPKKSTKKSITINEDSQRRLFRIAFGEDDVVSTDVKEPITVSSFYSAMCPAPSLSSKEALASMQPDGLLPSLLPFQCRSVAWLLGKEGMSVSLDGTIVAQDSPSLFSFWKELQLGNQTLYFNRLSGDLTDDRPSLPIIHGGMLAEEPGLGKTLETIALIMLNPAPRDWNPSFECWDDIAFLNVKAVKTTLIVTPPSLVFQWRDELANHAPSLKVLIYDGWTKVAVPIVKSDSERLRLAAMKKKRSQAKGKKAKTGNDDSLSSSADSQLEWPAYVHQFDVVITTYSVLRSEIWVARPSLDRPRKDVTTPTSGGYARSPLVIVKWKRVVMDEVQMVGGGQAAEMVSYVPRLSSLAVSGTPAKAHMLDLIHVLKFLRIDKVVGNLKLWNRLLKSGFSEEFFAFIQHYGIRTAKAGLTSELTIPKQTRYLVGIELGRVERHVYDQALEAVLFDLGLDARGVAASNGWKVDGNLLRSSIRRLRGICTHPQVGQLQRKGDGLYKPGTLKTMEDVLQAMRDQNWKNMMEDWKAKIQVVIKSAQLVQHDEADKNRYQRARDMLLEAETDIQRHIDEIKAVLDDHDLQGKALKGQPASLDGQQHHDMPVDITGKGKARMVSDDSDIEEADYEDSEDEERGLPKNPAGDEHRSKRRAIKQRLRETLVLLHKVKFLRGDVYHVLGNTMEEDAAYQVAEELRRQLLKVSEEGTKKAIHILSTNAKRKNLTAAELAVDLPLLGKGGTRSAEMMEEVNIILEEVFNAQGTLLWKWRTHLMNLLTTPLTTHDGGAADGQEYQRTLDEQGEAETYLQAYSALLADRRQALVNERTLLAEHEVRETKLRQTKAAMRAAINDLDEDNDEEFPQLREELELQPEHEVLHKDLSTQRKDILQRLNGRAIKSVLVELTGVNLRITQESHPEKIIVKDAIKSIRQFTAEQSTLFERLEGDLALIRKAFNHRVLYFRQLQEISDSVVDVEWENSVTAALELCQAEKVELDAKINTTRARHRYLVNLAEDNEDESDDDYSDQSCILCRCDFTRGFITHCAHVFCEPCMKLWLSKDKGKSCPVCRVAIDLDGIQRFSVDAAEHEKEIHRAIAVTNEPVPKSHRELVYNRISASVLEDIQGIETHGDFGTKIQTLVRHLLYLKLVDPGAKSIVFSAWADSLHIVEVALRQNDINCLRISQTSKVESATQKFRKDPNILVLLLDGERENAGLNITCASRVFLLESVVHHSFEVQAIARIDRLGQTRPTEVYCYYAEDTVERNILDLAARKGLSLYTKDNAVGTVSVSPFAAEREQVIDSPEKRKAQHKGDFIYKVDDMLAILFPHMFEDVEYLIPASEENLIRLSTSVDVEMSDATLKADCPVRGGIMINAEAGPSCWNH